MASQQLQPPHHHQVVTNRFVAACQADGYEKAEQAIPVEQLSPLQATFCPLEQDAMLRAAIAIVRFYQELGCQALEV